MRIRSIKPEFWRSSDISRLVIEDRLLFIGLWSYVDDSGVGLDKLSAIAADLFADDLEIDPPETFARVSRGLARLSEAKRIIRYTVDGVDFMMISNWSKHQRIDKPGKARFPTPDWEGAVIRESVARARESVAPGTGEQGNRGTDKKDYVHPSEERPSKSDLTVQEFEAWWATYPRKQGKGDALKAFKAARKKASVETLTKAVAAYKLATVGVDKSLIKMPAGWLRAERWEDEVVIQEPAQPSAGWPPAPSQVHSGGTPQCFKHAGYPVPCDRCREDSTEAPF